MGFALSDLQLTSPVFKHGGAIPSKHTGEGEDLSPALAWRDTPANTKSLAIFCHDPDAPLVSQHGSYGFVHWVLYNIPATVSNLEQHCQEYTQGMTDFGRSGYGGPMPPPGHGCHHYYFWLLALDIEAALPDSLGLSQLLQKVEPHIIGMNRLIGTYERQ